MFSNAMDGNAPRHVSGERLALMQDRERLLDREDRTLHIGVEDFVNVLGCDLADRELASRTGIGEDDVEGHSSLL
jgi:hypothetical protein